jgi:hypothetical protein
MLELRDDDASATRVERLDAVCPDAPFERLTDPERRDVAAARRRASAELDVARDGCTTP